MKTPITSAQKADFAEHGYVILENALDTELLHLARAKCDAAVEFQAQKMRDVKETDQGINLLDRRYFVSGYYNVDPALGRLLYSDLMASICCATIGGTAFLHNEQFVVKLRDPDSVFAWHQDSGYSFFRGGAERHTPYLTCWIALDDMTRANGTISVLPFARAGGGKLTDHIWNESEAALVGYDGDDPGELIEIPAGSVVCFSSVTLHRSGPNTTEQARRSYIIQYTPASLYYREEPGKPYETNLGPALPFLHDGARVDEPH